MDFSSRPNRVRNAPVVLIVLSAGFLGQAQAAPFDDPHVGGLTFSGPTSATLGAVYWNPAALGLVRGNQLVVGAGARLTRTTVNRDPINADGTPGGTMAPGSATGSSVTQPFSYPIGPGGFAAISTDLGGDRATLAFAVYQPFVEKVRFPTTGTGTEPNRYHRIEADFRNLALVPALAVRFGGDFRIGFAPGLMFSTGRLTFAEPVPGAGAGGEDAAGDARYDINSGQGIGDAKFSLTLAGGIYYRRRTVEFGLAYTSRPFGGDVTGVQVAGERTTVFAPGGAPVACRPANTDPTAPGAAESAYSRCVFGDIVYRLPDVLVGGVTWHPRPGWEVTGIVRWIRSHVMERMDIRLSGAGLQSAGLPQHIVLHQGFQDVWDVRARVSYWVKERLHLGAALRLETSAVPAASASPAAVDGLKVEPMLLAELNLGRHFALTAGYALTLMGEVAARPSAFQPLAAGQCASGTGATPANDLANPGCVARAQGLARPTAQGTYGRFVQDFSLSMTLRF